jgi:predicted NAD/FAD-dependent oxidoreductase
LVAATAATAATAAPIVVVGAGLAGLTAARDLGAAGHTVVVVERDGGVGGRLSTEVMDGARIDVGAQFFTVRSPSFAAMASRWLGDDVAYEWCRGFDDPPDGYPRYAGRGGMVVLARALADGIDVRCGQRVSAVSPVAAGWAVSLGGTLLSASAVILTPPVPESRALLEAEVPELDVVAYEPTLAVGVVLESRPAVPPPGAVQLTDGPFSFVADNQTKGISPRPALTLHATGEVSRRWWDADDAVALDALLHQGRRWLGPDPRVVTARLIRWPYARPTSLYPAPCLVIDKTAPLVFAGDAFGQARVEGAVLSGQAAAAALGERG